MDAMTFGFLRLAEVANMEKIPMATRSQPMMEMARGRLFMMLPSLL
ncbi:MAG TPA: hypothetical protein PK653_09225 [Syntrophales bacterium]|jgi:hypothetical protein|nr:hypothetical protein [Syntrophales bacterium]